MRWRCYNTPEVIPVVKLGNVVILGDSYSTFLNCIPEGYSCWYDLTTKRDTDVYKVEETWWHQLMSNTESKLIHNNSWSGSTVCHRGYNGDDVIHNSFVTRFDQLAEKGFFDENKVDTFIIFGATNDNWANSPLGQLQYENWTTEDLYNALPAFCYLIHRVKEVLPQSRILWIINTEFRPEVQNGLLEACNHYGIEAIVLQDIEKQSGHPNKAGMHQIYEQVKAYLEK